MSPTEKLPILRDGNEIISDANEIIENLSKKVSESAIKVNWNMLQGYYLDFKLQETEISERNAFIALVERRLYPAMVFFYICPLY
jgi:hypothetical protein